ncbi:MAG: hypothetical protein KDB02_15165 [Acidimicrobiales bacterium]|nr:hypothetical protein [Acidimicrobiales bacterium]
MVTQVNPDVKLTAMGDEARTIEEWTTTFQLLTVVLDPYTQESAWLLPTAGRFLSNFRGASVRAAWTVTADERDARKFLGPWAEQFLTFTDPDRELIGALEIERTPALAYVRQDLAVIGTAEGWEPSEWERLGELVGKVNSWSFPQLPEPGDPGPFKGAPAKG